MKHVFNSADIFTETWPKTVLLILERLTCAPTPALHLKSPMSW